MNTTTTVTASDVKLVALEVDHGDKQSYGEFSLKAETPFGTLTGTGYLASNGSQEEQVWMLGEVALDGAPDLGIPHANAGRRAVARFEKNQEQEVCGALADWLNSRNSAGQEQAYEELFATVNGR